MFNVLVAFKDLEDKNHIYQVNDTYPRSENKKVTKERIDSLSSTNNLRGKVLIERNKLEDMELDNLKKYCKIMGIKYSKSAEKEELIEEINAYENNNSELNSDDTPDELDNIKENTSSDDEANPIEKNPELIENE